MSRVYELDEDIGEAKGAPAGGRWRMSVRGLMKLVFASACVLALISILVGPWSNCRCDWKAVRRYQCANNLKSIGIALQTYHERYGSLPPAYVADASGRPMHSWRVLILPFLEHQALYGRYDFREPWDGPNNRKLLGEIPVEFGCPSRNTYPTTVTSYVAITGPGTMFPGTSSVRLADVTDGLERTLAVVETSNLVVPWTAPLDLDLRTMSLRINAPRDRGISSLHTGGANVVFGDAHIGCLKDGIAEKKVRSLITIAGQDGNPDDDGSPSY